MVKRGSVNDFGQERTRIVTEVENLIVSGDAARVSTTGEVEVLVIDIRVCVVATSRM